MSVNRFFFTILIATAAILPCEASEEDCEELLESKVIHSRVYTDFRRKVGNRTSITVAGSVDALKRFWRESMPYLRQIAAENSVTPSELISEYVDIFVLLSTEFFGRDPMQLVEQQVRSGQQALVYLEALPATAKLRKKEIYALADLATLLLNLSNGLANFELMAGRPVTFDPTRFLHERTGLKRLMEGLEYYDLTRAIDAHYSHVLRTESLVKLPQAVAEPTVAEASQIVEDLFEPSPELSPEFSQLEAPQFETNFALAVLEKLPLRANHRYEVLLPNGELYTTLLTSKLVNVLEEEGADRDVAYKMLRAFILGRKGFRGLKFLRAVGPDVIELKAVFHGHKRIIGCIKGRHVHLIEMIDIKESVATYARRIPHNYCANL